MTDPAQIIDLDRCRVCPHRTHDLAALLEKLAQAHVRLWFACLRPWLP